MKYQYNNIKGFSIILALGLTLLFSFTGLYLLEYMIPFSQNTKGVENASKAFYKGYAGIEDSLYGVSQGNIGDEFTKTYSSVTDFSYQVTASGNTIPLPGTGDSPTDSDYNMISLNDPIQLLVGKGRLTNPSRKIDLQLKSSFGSLKKTGTGVILWQLSSQNNTYSPDDITSSSNDLVQFSHIDNVQRNLLSKQAIDISDPTNPLSLWNFYNAECMANECVLKLTLINPLISLSGNSKIPYIEYKIGVKSTDSIPLRFSQIEANGKSYGFTKKLQVTIPQQTSNAAFDFTILQ